MAESIPAKFPKISEAKRKTKTTARAPQKIIKI